MKIEIVYDNTIFEKDKKLKSGWGFSCLIRSKKEKILFDTGAKGKILLNNMETLGIDPSLISKIIISHEHWDHNGGLKKLKKTLNKEVKIYRFKEKKTNNKTPIIVTESIKISENIYSTGKMKGNPVDEQSLILKGKKGLFALAGCSHNGVKNIINKTGKYGEIKGIIGGLHGFSEFEMLKELDLVCPTHCTKYIKKIKELYPEKYIEGGVGRKIEI